MEKKECPLWYTATELAGWLKLHGYPRVACQNCDQREGCPTPFIPKQIKQEEMKF